MNIDELFPSRYLRPADLGRRKFHVTIAGVRMEQVHVARSHRDEAKPVLYLERARKGLILSAHNAHTIAGLHGPETEAWPGRRITLFVQRGVEAFGQVYDVVRVRPSLPQTAVESGDGSLPLEEEDEVDAGWDGDEDLDELEREEGGTTRSDDGHPPATKQSGAAGESHCETEGTDDSSGQQTDRVTEDLVRRDCVGHIRRLPEEEQSVLFEALATLTDYSELRCFRRYLIDERREAEEDGRVLPKQDEPR